MEEVPLRTQLTPRQRLCVFHKTRMSTDAALALDESELTMPLLVANGVRANNLVAAGIGPRMLHTMGATSPQMLQTLGFNALHLTDNSFAIEARGVYGAEPARTTFLQTASDAVALAGSDAVSILDIHVRELLVACAGAAIEAQSVLQQLPKGGSLHGVPASTLLDTGLRKSTLAQLGYGFASVATQTGAKPHQMAMLGYRI